MNLTCNQKPKANVYIGNLKILGEIKMIKKCVLFSMLFFLFACQSTETSGLVSFEELYDGELANVSKIQIRAADGELKSVIVKEEIDDWLESVKDIEIVREESDETNKPSYTVLFFEDANVTFTFSTGNDDILTEKIEELFYHQAINISIETISFQDPTEVQLFTGAVETANQLEGIVNMANPDFYFFLENKLYGLWVSDKSGVIMNMEDTHTIYELTNESFKAINNYLENR